ncbi:MAG: hypothetical protein ACKO7G_04955, partial [Gammaproteobacteria bacterium]
MTSKDPRKPRPMPTTAPSISAAAMVARAAMLIALIALVGCAAPPPKAAPPVAAAAATQPAPAYPAEIVAREACPARDPDYG